MITKFLNIGSGIKCVTVLKAWYWKLCLFNGLDLICFMFEFGSKGWGFNEVKMQ